jgi:phosphoglycerate kinase
MQTLESIDFTGKRVILRCDLNVPLKNGEITDPGRILASLPTIELIRKKAASIVILAHLGRPKNGFTPELSLTPVANRLGELLKDVVSCATDIAEAKKLASARPGTVVLLENIRFFPAETSKEESERMAFARELATLGEVYVGDGFGAVHRKHASVYDLPLLMPHCAGRLIYAEMRILNTLATDPDRPYGVILGGAKVSDKIGVIANLLERVDILAIGGGMVFTFLAAMGKEIGNSLVDREQIPQVRDLIARAQERGVQLLLPDDVVVAPAFAADSPATVVSVDSIPADQIGLDIGPASAKRYAEALENCRTVFWNGPMGVFEFPAFAHGTRVIAQALSELPGLSVVGGGDSAAAIRLLGFDDEQFGYISTGGGASLEFLEGKELPGIKVLES